jgi:hypothetical protein
MSRIGIQYVDGEPNAPDYLYFNADIVCNRTKDQGLGTDPLISFSESRDTAIINDASQYYFSIIRFSLQGAGKDTPIFIPVVQTGQSDPNKTVYSTTLKTTVNYDIGGTVKTFTGERQLFVQYSPESVFASLPPAPLERQFLGSKYYYVYTYQHWVDLVNQNLVSTLALLQSDFATWYVENGGTAPAPTLTTKAPYIIFNSTTGLFSIYADKYGFGGDDRTSKGSTTDDEDFELYFNSNMFGMYSNFNNEYYGQDNDNGKDNFIIFQDKLGTNSYTYDGTEYWINIQDYESTSTLWCPIESIVFTTSLIPIIPELQGQPVNFGESNIVRPFTSSSAFQPIITDIVLPLGDAHGYRGNVVYNPTAEYRLASLTSSRQEVRQIDVNVYWRNRLDNELYPITMFNLSSVSIKMMFRKKTASILK